ncbi:FAD-dependent monooxygenase [Saccharospirillum impatiens]|uniref:FAD-dependent monooxygenase n=1 Tax=Saccharospirillum impatiens TaxID=169438 RepID=UPI0003F71F6E|nr:FAD-dependent monooxygenase [Saccharospirillum impatiens]
MMKPFDIAIVGGGLVGLTLVRALQPALTAGARLVVIDPAPKPTHQAPQSPSFDDRATALSAYSCLALSRLGLGEPVERYSSAIRWIEVSDRGHAGYQVMDAAHHSDGAFGRVIANAALGQILWQGVQSLPGADWYFGTRVQQIKPGQTNSTLKLDNGETLSARLIILCDGGRSPLTEQLGIGHTQRNYNARAVIATARTEQPHAGRAYERFTESGPIALLPFGDFSALVWTIPARLEKRFQALNENDRLTLLNQHFGQRLGRITELGPLTGYPLQRRTATELVRHRLLVLGNAAATLHPVAGQGFNLALRSVLRTATVLNQHLILGEDAGAIGPLHALAAAIQADQSVTAGFSDTLVRSFGSARPWLQLGRTLGLNALDRHPLLGRSFALASMGLLQGAPLPHPEPTLATDGLMSP